MVFKENNIKVLLKYDGEREKNLFTIVFYDMLDLASENTLRRDTDKPYDVYFEFMRIKGIQELDCELLDFFIHSTESLIKTLGRKMIFIITMGSEAQCYLYVNDPASGAYRQIYASKGSSHIEFTEFLETINAKQGISLAGLSFE